jgi:carboxypeptidase C (cathepsin A)
MNWSIASTLRFCVALAFSWLAGMAAAVPPPGPPSPSTWPALTDQATKGPRQFVTRHKGKFGGKVIEYRATIGETIVKGPDGAPAGSAFPWAFSRLGVQNPAARPVLFIYNGGPGCAASGLFLGAFGPKHMTSLSSAALADPKTPVVDNTYAPLDSADLVFIDPLDTGYSRRLPDTQTRLFLSIDGDSFEVGQIILHWLSANGRLDSPVYLVGESYGTLRNVALARDFAKATPKIHLEGLVMVSQAITYDGPAMLAQRRGPDPLRAIVRIPDVAAEAWYHGRIDNQHQTVEEAVVKARTFARTEYATALLQGNRLDEATRQHIASRLAELTGIPAEYYLEHNLRINDYRRELLRSDGRALAQFDGRETEPLAGLPEDKDRDWDAAFAGLNHAMDFYATQDLGVKGLGNYISCVHDPYGYEEGWTYIVPPAPTLDVVLTDAVKSNLTLRLMVPQGIFDTTSSMGSTTSLFEQLDVPANRVAITYYAGGHMVYADLDSLEKFMEDVRVFVSGRNPSGAFPRVAPPTSR